MLKSGEVQALFFYAAEEVLKGRPEFEVLPQKQAVKKYVDIIEKTNIINK